MRPILSLRSYPPHETEHAHDWHQIVVPVDGTMQMRIAGQDGIVDDSSFVIVASQARHRFTTPHHGHFVVLDVPTGAGFFGLPDRLVQQAEGQPFHPLDAGLRHLAHYIAHDAAAPARRSDLLDRLGGMLLEAVAERSGDRLHWPPALERAVSLLGHGYDATLTVQQLAVAAGVSVSGLHALFQRWIGMSPGRYLADLRLREAEQLIRETRRPLAEIALAVGFSDQSALTRSLRRRRSTTPAALRRGD
ncbi:AraC family transcriptional regulator [Bosea sp. 2RAB26]|uniref:helix-turn-helix transcriptional regulator n=1 Tax=Bosea sp. 2RAB26 TaxID=3237476 RepID=UPI003F92A424